jgi:hypothetical protein
MKQGNKCFSAEELDVAIETLKLAQQTLKQTNKPNLQKQKVKPNNENIISKNTVSPEVPITQETENNKILPLPSYNWFVTVHDGKPASNTFTGSRRKDSTKGLFSTTTFNYKVSVSNVGKEDAKIIVNCFLEKPWYKGDGHKLLAENEFECSSCGLTEAADYLNNECQKFMEDDTIV